MLTIKLLELVGFVSFVLGLDNRECFVIVESTLLVEVPVMGVMLDTETDDKLIEVDTITLLTKPFIEGEKEIDESLGRTEDEVDMATLLTRLLDGTEGELDTGTMLLAIGVVPDEAEGERGAKTADDGVVELTTAALKEEEVGVGSANAGTAMASPQASTAMEHLRWVCMLMWL